MSNRYSSTMNGSLAMFNSGGFHGHGGTRNGSFIRENLLKIDNLGIPPFMETPMLWLNYQGVLPGGIWRNSLAPSSERRRLQSRWGDL